MEDGELLLRLHAAALTLNFDEDVWAAVHDKEATHWKAAFSSYQTFVRMLYKSNEASACSSVFRVRWFSRVDRAVGRPQRADVQHTVQVA